jgi:hypothetical protein
MPRVIGGILLIRLTGHADDEQLAAMDGFIFDR